MDTPMVRRQALKLSTSELVDTQRPADALLSAQMQRHVDRTLAADRKGGEALWEKACAVADARADAEHGEWGRYLEATGQNERAARRLVAIAERGRAEGRFRDALISGFLSFSVAAITAQADDALLEGLLASPEPPTRRDVEALTANRTPVSDLPSPKTKFTDAEIAASIRSCLLRLDAHGAEPLIYGIKDRHTLLMWERDLARVAGMAGLVAEEDYAGAVEQAMKVDDVELRVTLAKQYAELTVQAVDERIAAAEEEPEPPVPVSDDEPLTRGESDALMSLGWKPSGGGGIGSDGAVFLTCIARDGRKHDGTRAQWRAVLAGEPPPPARLSADLTPPAPTSDPTEPTPQNALAAIAARVAALDLDGPPLIVAGELDRARQQAQYLVTQGRLSQDATRLVVSEIIGRGYRVAEPLAAAAGLDLRVGSYEPSADRWTLAGPEGGEAFRGGQLGALIRRIAALGAGAGAPPAEEVVPEAPAENVATLARDAIAAAMDCMIARRPGDIDVDALDHLQDRLIVLSAAEAGTFSELIAVVVEYAETSR